jgi:serine/threonine protein kinase/tetratricopeptide (TPR) repeat protein
VAPLIGQIVSHYRIIELLGGGGMGVVYKAEDTRLKRAVALKFLPTAFSLDLDAKARFIHEAEAASALDHPNICNVHDIDETPDGQIFICMACYEGETLKKKLEHSTLSLPDAIDIAMQVARGLQAAHEAGMVHRDVKPANIMVTAKGEAKILDFGLAKLAGQAVLTKTGSTIGTAAYVSPEQGRGEEVDQRSDIFSLGVVLYEMVTGHRPFRGEHEAAITYSLLNETPEPLARYKVDVPDELQRVIDKSLAKERGDRYQHIDEMLVDLRRVQQETPASGRGKKKVRNVPLLVGAAIAIVALAILVYYFVLRKPASPGAQSVAVLPFVDMSPQKDQEYFCDGMAEELINRLTKIRDLRVPARTSAFMFKGKMEDIRDIGSKLNVETVLEGSVRKAGDSLRVTAQLINVVDGYHLWSETYDGAVKDIFAIQDEIALAIAEKLRITLLGEQRANLSKSQTYNPDAYTLYLKGRQFRFRENLKDDQEALSYFQQAIKADSQYALALAGLADIYFMLDLHSGPQPKYHRQSLSAATRALELDSTLAEGFVAMGLIRNFYESNWTAAELSYERAIEVNPREWNAHREYGLLLLRTGRVREALAELQTTANLDPLSWIATVWLGLCYAQTDNHQMAIDQLQKARHMAAGAVSYEGYLAGELGRMYFLEGSQKKAQEEFKKADITFQIWYLVRCGEREKASAMIDSIEHEPLDPLSRSYTLAYAYACVGENDKAFSELDTVYSLKPMALLNITIAPQCEGLRSDPRFAALLRKMGMY